jgi:hypothetical protein
VPELTQHELETAKMYQDTFKHLTIFSSGAILLSSSVVAAFFKNQTDLWTLFVSLAFFLISAAFATFGLYFTVRHLDRSFSAGASDATAEIRKSRRTAFFLTSVITVYMGVVLFGAFAVINFGN